MAAHGVCLVVLATQLAVLRGGHLLRVGGYAEAELLAESIGLRQDVVAYLLGELCGAGIDFAKFCLLCLVKAYTLALEAVEMLLEHHLLLAGEGALVAVVNGGDAVVEGLVEGNVVAVLAQKRYGLVLNGVESVAAVGLADIVEHSGNFADDASGKLQRSDCILKGRSVRI